LAVVLKLTCSRRVPLLLEALEGCKHTSIGYGSRWHDATGNFLKTHDRKSGVLKDVNSTEGNRQDVFF
jgi:hypothetical protein